MPNHHPSEIADMYAAEARALREQLAICANDLTVARSDIARAMHALDCALAWGEALMLFLPHGQPLPPGLGAAKGALDVALKGLQR